MDDKSTSSAVRYAELDERIQELKTQQCAAVGHCWTTRTGTSNEIAVLLLNGRLVACYRCGATGQLQVSCIETQYNPKTLAMEPKAG